MVETVQYDKYKEAWGTNINIATMKPMNATQLALRSNPISVTNYTDGNVHEMYTFNHAATEQTPALTDYRYIGNDPYNYVYFNCDSLDNQNSETCEVWRIIGVFDVERPDPNDNTQMITERRMKLVRGSALPVAKQWDTRNSELYPNNNWGKNEWKSSLIEMYLNDEGEYYTRSGSASNFGLKATAKSLISDAKYYLGGGKYNNNTPNGYGTAEDLYYWERGIEVFSQENLCLNNPGWDQCSINYCNNNLSDEICNATRSASWNGKVSLMYSSDIYLTYVNGIDNVCYNKPHECYIYYDGNPSLSWIHNSNIIQGEETPSYIWLISPKSDDSNHVFGSGSVLGTYAGSNLYGVRPTLYLSSSVKIIDGDRSINNPYWLGL